MKLLKYPEEIDYIYSDIVFVSMSDEIKRKWNVGNLSQNDIFSGKFLSYRNFR